MLPDYLPFVVLSGGTALAAEIMKPVRNWNLTNDKMDHCVYYRHGSTLAFARAADGTAATRRAAALHVGKDALKVHQTSGEVASVAERQAFVCRN